MDDLIAFLNARFDEDEQAARDAGAEAWRKAKRPSIWVERDGSPVAQTKYFEDAAHITRHDPARVLREVEAKRRILHEHRPIVDGGRDPAWPAPGHCVGCWSPGHEDYEPFPCQTVRLLALPYANHFDYRGEWKL